MSRAANLITLLEETETVEAKLTKHDDGDWVFIFKNWDKKKLRITSDKKDDNEVGRIVVGLLSKDHKGSDYANDGETYLLDAGKVRKLINNKVGEKNLKLEGK